MRVAGGPTEPPLVAECGSGERGSRLAVDGKGTFIFVLGNLHCLGGTARPRAFPFLCMRFRGVLIESKRTNSTTLRETGVKSRRSRKKNSDL